MILFRPIIFLLEKQSGDLFLYMRQRSLIIRRYFILSGTQCAHIKEPPEREMQFDFLPSLLANQDAIFSACKKSLKSALLKKNTGGLKFVFYFPVGVFVTLLLFMLRLSAWLFMRFLVAQQRGQNKSGSAKCTRMRRKCKSATWSAYIKSAHLFTFCVPCTASTYTSELSVNLHYLQFSRWSLTHSLTQLGRKRTESLKVA